MNYKVGNRGYLATNSNSMRKHALVLSVVLEQTGLIRNENRAG